MATISGNAGAPGVWVKYIGATQGGFVLSDGSGNFVTPALGNDTYVITPNSAIKSFSPLNQTKIFSGVNITGVNFTASAASDPIIFTQLGADSGTRANENPLNPANWKTMTSGGYAGNSLRIVSNTFEATAALGSMNLWIGSAVPADQYVDIQIAALDIDAFTTSLTRNTAPAHFGAAYELDFGQTVGGSTAIYFIQISSDGSAIDFDFYNGLNMIVDIQIGDVFRQAVVGQTAGFAYIYKNGILLDKLALNLSPSVVAAGYTGLQIQTPGSIPGAAFVNFATGSAVLPSNSPFFGMGLGF